MNATFFIFIARPKKLNCLSLAMIRKMTKTVKEWNQKNSGVQVVVVRGAGETSEPVLVDGEDNDNHYVDWQWYINKNIK